MALDPRPLPHQEVIASDLHAARRIQEEILARAQALGYSEKCVFGIRLALEEAMVNAHKHGNRGDSSKHITVSYEVNRKRVIVRIRDEGPGFNPDKLPDPTSCERITLPNGRGVMLMRSFVDEVCFSETGNEVQLVKRRG